MVCQGKIYKGTSFSGLGYGDFSNNHIDAKWDDTSQLTLWTLILFFSEKVKTRPLKSIVIAGTSAKVFVVKKCYWENEIIVWD